MVNAKLKDKLKEMLDKRQAILAVNFYNFETLKGLLVAAHEEKQPIILQLTRSSIEYMGLQNAYNMAKNGLEYYNLEGWIHLDHGDSDELAEQCINIGFDSVMFDGSELDFEQNIEITAKVVKYAQKFNVNVEAELGYVAKLGQSNDKVAFTEPEDAKIFVDNTGINALAVAVGSAHGFYKQEPKLDYDRISAIRKITNTPLVLHGGSGIPPEYVRKAVYNGICKVNVATETKNIFIETLQNILKNNTEIDLRKVFPPAIDAVVNLIKTKFNILK